MRVIVESGLAIAIALAPLVAVSSGSATPARAPDGADAGIVRAAASSDVRWPGFIIPCGTHLTLMYYWEPLRGPLMICRFGAWDESRAAPSS